MTDRGFVPTPRRLTVPALLTARAARRPRQVALLLDGTRSLTLAEWEKRSSHVARRLSGLRVGPGDRVGLVFGGESWIEYAIGYCAVLAAGGVAVPLADNMPAAQLRERLDHCSAAALVHTSGADVAGLGLAAASLRSLEDGPPPVDDEPFETAADPDALAEIVYVSRNGGPPRGVTATHANITFGLAEGDAADAGPPFGEPGYVLCCFPVGTFAGQWVLVRSLAGRATVLMTSHFAPDHVGRMIEAHRVGAVLLVPTMATDLLDAGTHLKYDLSSVGWAGSGAAPLLPARVNALRTVFPNAVLVNHYGSAESAPAVTRMVVDDARPNSVGRPVDGTELLIAGRDGAPLPAGRVGEVLLRSAAPARAYHLDARATARTFGRGWTRMGDLGYLDGEGYLHLVGRRTDVITSGGAKVSTSGVEAALFEHPAVAEAAVVGVAHPVIGQTVAAAVVLRQPVQSADLREFLRDRLASYELPNRILVLDALPRDSMGRVDTGAVRRLLADGSGQPPIPPSSPVEVALAEQWSQVLHRPVTGVDDDFFALGGDSLRAALLAARAEHAFGVRTSASLVFDLPVLAAQAGWLASRMSPAARAGRPAEPGDGADGSAPASAPASTPAGSVPAAAAGPKAARTAAPLAARLAGPLVTQPAAPARIPLAGANQEPEERTVARVPLSPFQERSLMWMFGGRRPRRSLPVVASMRIHERLDVRTMRRSLNEVAYRQESLRTVFAPTGSGYEAITLPDCLPNFVSIRAPGSTLDQREERARRLVREFVERPFDIVRGPLFRALVIQLGEEDNVLVLAVDQLVSDGLSIEVLLGELGAIYAAFRAGERSPLPPVELRCSDFLAWVREQFGHTRGYWERVLAGAPPAVGPLPGQDTSARSVSARQYQFGVPAELGDRLRWAYPEHGVTSFMAAIAAWSGVLTSLAGLPEIVLCAPMSGRTRPEFEGLVGSILQSPFFRLRTSGDPTFRDLFGQARRSVVAATEHQFYPHHEFSSRVPFPARFDIDESRPPAVPGLDSDPFQFHPSLLPDRPLDEGEADLDVPRLGLATQQDGSIRGTLSYNGHAFQPDAVEGLARRFLRFTDVALADPDRRLSELS